MKIDFEEAVLVPEAQTRAGVAVIRSLGRAGYKVVAVSADPDALGLKSNYSFKSIVHPAYNNDQFYVWLRNIVQEHNIKMIVPSSNFLLAIRDEFKEFSSIIPLHSDENSIYPNFLKTHVVKKFELLASEGLLENHPESLLLESPSNIQEISLPNDKGFGFYLKAEDSKDGLRMTSDQGELLYVKEKEQLLHHIESLLQRWNKVLLQVACTGYQVGVSVLMDDGKALSVNCVRDCYDEPHSKGTMSLRKTHWDHRIVEDAIKRLTLLGWKGCAMAEYRVDPVSGEFWLIEINFRFWQYLHLDMHSGIDFPLYQAQWFLNGKTEFPKRGTPNVVCRDTWPGEVTFLLIQLRSNEKSIKTKIYLMLRFLFLCLDFRVKNDFWFEGDRKLYLPYFSKYLQSMFRNIKRRILKKHS